ncbi:MAG: hypothetical protein J7527_09110 [Chitinophagaceae bacterium]|nr:hypothetical protein [Chitinophagaceae bacterium]
MEFEELQKIWLAGNQEAVYVINEQALHHRITAKRHKVLHIANVSELLLVVVNIAAGIFVLTTTYFSPHSNVFLYLMAGWMFLTAGYALVHRLRRLRAQPVYDRSLQQELQHALATATYQVRLSQLMRLNVIPIGALTVLGIWQGDKPIWLAAVILLFFCGAYYFSGWEHNYYKRQQRELEGLVGKLKES